MMTERESAERFDESMKKAAARARELGQVQNSEDWLNVATNLDKVRKLGLKLLAARSLTRQETLAMLDQHLMTPN